MSINPIPTSIPQIPRWSSFLSARKFIGNPISEFQRYTQDYGDTYKFFMGGVRPSIVSSHPDIVQHVLQKNHRNYSKSKFQTDVLSKYVGKGLLTSTGDQWMKQRRLIQPGFHKKKIAGLTALIQKEIDISMIQLEKDWIVGTTCNVHNFMNELTFNIIGKTLFSDSIDSDSLKKLSDFITTFQKFIIKEVRLPFLKPWYRISGEMKKVLVLADQARAIIGDIIHKRQKEKTTSDDLLKMFLDSRYEDTGLPMSHDQLIDECMILFVAGHETSSNALSWTIALLAKNYNVRSEALKEIKAQQDEPKSDYSYLQMIIQESMRMYPPAWLIDRIAIADDEIMGLKIPAGTVFLLHIYGLHNDKEIWEEPMIFNPERFDEINTPRKTIKAYYPFGAGPRMCIGNHLALLEIQMILIAFIKNYPDFSLTHPWPALEPMITLRPKNGVFIQHS